MIRISSLITIIIFAYAAGPLTLSATEAEAEIIELEAFVVYAGLIDIIDGHTGEAYHKNNPVVLRFQEEFNPILLAYHKRLLQSQFEAIKEHVERDKLFIHELSVLAESFGAKGFSIEEKELLSRDKSMLARLAKDPFFKIEQLVIWDLEKLNRRDGKKPRSEFARDIRFNEMLQRWERRITTEWRVHAKFTNRWGGERVIDVTKRQGLNLETNQGYHFCPPGIPANVPPNAFQDVILNYPIFVNALEPVNQQVERLKNEFVINLSHIYDPFSWYVRSNIRYRGTFHRRLLPFIQSQKFPVTDRDWFDQVLARLLCDITSMKLFGAGEIYDFAMLTKIPVNNNRLGEGLDLLNWNPGEDRQVAYNPNAQYPVRIDFDSAQHARFILVDAYRRYEDQFLSRLRERLANSETRVSGKELIKEVLSEVSGVPAEIYIEAATKAQIVELEKHRHPLD